MAVLQTLLQRIDGLLLCEPVANGVAAFVVFKGGAPIELAQTDRRVHEGGDGFQSEYRY